MARVPIIRSGMIIKRVDWRNFQTSVVPNNTPIGSSKTVGEQIRLFMPR